MATDRERVAVISPQGFTVLVSPRRADTLVSRGYRRSTASTTDAGVALTDVAPVKRADLSARAKALGIPAKGTNEELAAAIAKAEAKAG